TLLGAWLAWSLRVPEPLLDLHVLTRPVVLYTNIANVLLGYVMFGVFFLVPYLVSGGPDVDYGLGVHPGTVGLFLLPSAVGQGLTSLFAARLLRYFNPALPFAGGLGLCIAGAMSLALWHGGVWQILIPVFVLGAGFGLAIQISTALITQAVATTETAVATSMNSVVRRLGGSFGSQIAVALTAVIATAEGVAAEGAF